MTRSFHRTLVVILLIGSPVSAIAQAQPTSGGKSPAPAGSGGNAQTPAASSGNQPPAGPPEETPAKPIRNGSLFGGSERADNARSHVVDLTMSVSSAYDDDLSEGQGVGSQLQSPIGGQYSDLNAALTMGRKGPQVHVGARGSTSMRHYPALNSFVGSSHSGGADMAITLNRRTAFRANFEGSYVSTFALDTLSRQSGLSPTSASSSSSSSTTGFENAALDWTRMSYGGTVALSRTLGRHSFVSVTSSASMNERSLLEERAAVRSIGAQFGNRAGRDLSVWIDYSLRNGSQEFGDRRNPMTSHDAQFGIERRWRHPADRRTIFNVAAGPSLLLEGQQPGVIGQSSRSRLVPLVGSAALTHEMGRSWNVGVSYRRGAGFIDGALSSTATLDIKGLVNRRVELAGSAGYSEVDLVLGTSASRYGTTFGSTRVQVALTRRLAFYGQYSLYRYSFGNEVPLAADLPLQLQRRGFRVGLTLWMPLHQGR
jgi:hypothetical protein